VRSEAEAQLGPEWGMVIVASLPTLLFGIIVAFVLVLCSRRSPNDKEKQNLDYAKKTDKVRGKEIITNGNHSKKAFVPVTSGKRVRLSW